MSEMTLFNINALRIYFREPKKKKELIKYFLAHEKRLQIFYQQFIFESLHQIINRLQFDPAEERLIWIAIYIYCLLPILSGNSPRIKIDSNDGKQLQSRKGC